MANQSEYDALVAQKQARLNQLRQLKDSDYRDRLRELHAQEVERCQALLDAARSKQQAFLDECDDLYDRIEQAKQNLIESKRDARLYAKREKLQKLIKLTQALQRAQ